MKLEELQFNGSNGHSRTLIKSSGGELAVREELAVPLIWIDNPRILTIPKSGRLGRESQEEFCRRLIELQSPPQSMYFASSEDYGGLYMGVQYYRAANSNDALEKRIPVGSPRILRLPNISRRIDDSTEPFIRSCLLKDATDFVYITDKCGKFALVQYYKLR